MENTSNEDDGKAVDNVVSNNGKTVDNIVSNLLQHEAMTMISSESDCGGLDQIGKLIAQPPSSKRFTTTVLYIEAITNPVSGIFIHCPANRRPRPRATDLNLQFPSGLTSYRLEVEILGWKTFEICLRSLSLLLSASIDE
nr:hypothetical protein CTI12_AA476010 [Tanacetum cinerariifolium]